MVEIGAIPIKNRQKSSTVETSHNAMLTEERRLNMQIATADSTLNRLRSHGHDLEAEYQHITTDIDGMSQAVSDVKARTEELRLKCADQMNVKSQYEYEGRRIHKLIHEQEKELAGLEGKLETIAKDIAKKEKEGQKLEEQIQRTRVDTAANVSHFAAVLKELAKETENNDGMRRELQRRLEGKENAAKAILAVEAVNDEMMKDIKAALSEKDRKQSIHDELAKKERELILTLTESALIRDRKAREFAAMKKRTLDCRGQAMERNLDFLDLCRKVEQNNVQLNELSELYEKVKLDRNKNTNTIQTSRQLIVEYKEKIRILENEVEVLRLEFEKVSDAVRLQKNDLTAAFKRRDATRCDLKQAEVGYKDLQTKIDFQSSEISRMNSSLSQVEDLIERNHSLYRNQASDCSNIQQMLIDKRDELTLIQEQFNRHEWVMKRGEVALRERSEELKLLTLQLNDFARQIDIMHRKVPQLRAYDNEIDELDRQLARERADVDAITAKLEAPDLKERQRAYCGKDFSSKELEEKVSVYEQRINSKEQQLWEKQILLREIEEKIAQADHQRGTDDPRIQKVLEREGQLRAETMVLRRKKFAALAESAVFKAQGTELAEEQNTVKQEITRAMERTARGKAFDDYAGKMVKMHERDLMGSSQKKQRTEFDSDEDEGKKPGRQHFDAYPTADGLSRPYGAFPVFQPMPPSGQLRHYRKEVIRPIEL
jgi:chromosome segregation ATPase